MSVRSEKLHYLKGKIFIRDFQAGRTRFRFSYEKKFELNFRTQDTKSIEEKEWRKGASLHAILIKHCHPLLIGKVICTHRAHPFTLCRLLNQQNLMNGRCDTFHLFKS